MFFPKHQVKTIPLLTERFLTKNNIPSACDISILLCPTIIIHWVIICIMKCLINTLYLTIYKAISGADSGKNLTVADFVRTPPGKFLKSSPILKQYLMHFERIFLSKKDKISVILRYFNKMRLRIYNYNKISHSNKLQRL